MEEEAPEKVAPVSGLSISGSSKQPGPPKSSVGQQPAPRVTQLDTMLVLPKFADPSVHLKGGAIFQVLASAIQGVPEFMGVTRTNLFDPTKIPSYIQRNESMLRGQAI